jgi:hypothetical protein
LVNGCEECQRLLLEYIEAVGTHWTLEQKLQAAVASEDPAAVQKLTPTVEKSHKRRIAALERFTVHEREPHENR